MAWTNELPTLLRSYINDISTSPKYPTADLQNFILLAGNLVQFDVRLKREYIFDIVGQTITPDPCDRSQTESRDDDAIALVIIRAGAVILETEVRAYGSQAIAIKDGKSSIDLKRDLRSLIQLSKGFSDRYDIAKQEFIRGNGAFGLSILSSRERSGSGSYWYTSLPRTYGEGCR